MCQTQLEIECERETEQKSSDRGSDRFGRTTRTQSPEEICPTQSCPLFWQDMNAGAIPQQSAYGSGSTGRFTTTPEYSETNLYSLCVPVENRVVDGTSADEIECVNTPTYIGGDAGSSVEPNLEAQSEVSCGSTCLSKSKSSSTIEIRKCKVEEERASTLPSLPLPTPSAQSLTKPSFLCSHLSETAVHSTMYPPHLTHNTTACTVQDVTYCDTSGSTNTTTGSTKNAKTIPDAPWLLKYWKLFMNWPVVTVSTGFLLCLHFLPLLFIVDQDFVSESMVHVCDETHIVDPQQCLTQEGKAIGQFMFFFYLLIVIASAIPYVVLVRDGYFQSITTYAYMMVMGLDVLVNVSEVLDWWDLSEYGLDTWLLKMTYSLPLLVIPVSIALWLRFWVVDPEFGDIFGESTTLSVYSDQEDELDFAHHTDRKCTSQHFTSANAQQQLNGNSILSIPQFTMPGNIGIESGAKGRFSGASAVSTEAELEDLNHDDRENEARPIEHTTGSCGEEKLEISAQEAIDLELGTPDDEDVRACENSGSVGRSLFATFRRPFLQTTSMSKPIRKVVNERETGISFKRIRIPGRTFGSNTASTFIPGPGTNVCGNSKEAEEASQTDLLDCKESLMIDKAESLTNCRGSRIEQKRSGEHVKPLSLMVLPMARFNLELVLSDPILKKALQEYAVSCWNSENLLCYEAIVEFESMVVNMAALNLAKCNLEMTTGGNTELVIAKREIEEKAKIIYTSYIAPTALMSVNVDYKTRNELVVTFQDVANSKAHASTARGSNSSSEYSPGGNGNSALLDVGLFSEVKATVGDFLLNTIRFGFRSSSQFRGCLDEYKKRRESVSHYQ
eukprot:CFRG2147T1